MRTLKTVSPRSALVPALIVALALTSGLAGVTGVDVPTQSGEVLVSVDWLAARLDDPRLVLLHIGPEDEYEAGHLPGARYAALSDLSAPEGEGEGLRLQMPDPAALVAALEQLGINDESRIVVYPGSDWVSAAARVVVTLDWIGLGDRVSLLDGGMGRWVEAGYPVTSTVEPVVTGSLSSRSPRDLVVSAEWVLDHLTDPGTRIIDARDPVHYDGTRPTFLHGEPVRRGHVPGAANIPFTSLWNEDLTLKSRDELARIFEEAGVRPGQTVVGYCHIGQYASGLITVARSLGYDVRLYDGSFQEWGSREELPVEGPGG